MPAVGPLAPSVVPAANATAPSTAVSTSAIPRVARGRPRKTAVSASSSSSSVPVVSKSPTGASATAGRSAAPADDLLTSLFGVHASTVDGTANYDEEYFFSMFAADGVHAKVNLVEAAMYSQLVNPTHQDPKTYTQAMASSPASAWQADVPKHDCSLFPRNNMQFHFAVQREHVYSMASALSPVPYLQHHCRCLPCSLAAMATRLSLPLLVT